MDFQAVSDKNGVRGALSCEMRLWNEDSIGQEIAKNMLGLNEDT